MRRGYICLVTGIASGLLLPQLLSLFLSILCISLAGFLFFFQRTRCISYYFIGLVWFSCYAQWQLNWLPEEFASGQEHTIVVQINSLNSRPTTQIYQAELISIDDYSPLLTKKVKLTWYRSEQTLVSGQLIRVKAKIKPVWGRANSVGFNQQAYLFSQHIGYQVDIKTLLNIESTQPSLRVAWHEKIKHYTQGLTHQGMLLALVFADKSNLAWPLRVQLQQMGLAHIMVISGLHIMLVGTAITALGWASLTLLNRLTGLKLNALMIAGLLGLGAAAAYAWLAGFSVPTQRALIMYGVVVATLLIQRKINPLDSVLVALVMVTLWDPLAVLGLGFWLSFAAVMSIFIIARFVPRQKPVGLRWLSYLLLFQFGLWLLMMPLQISQFAGVSLLSAINNVLFVPLMSIIVIPVCLFTALLLLMLGDVVVPGLMAVEWLLNTLVGVILKWPAAWLEVSAPQAYWLFVMAAGLWLIWQYYQSVYHATAGYAFILVAITTLIWQGGRASLPWQVVVLDVGQGLSVLIESQGEWLVYDTGFASDSGFSIAKTVLIPYLLKQQVHQLSHFVVSHQDNDHAGGAGDILAQFSVNQAWHNQAVAPFSYCQFNQVIQLGAFTGRFLSQDESLVGRKRNNTSCVLHLETKGFSLLLPGDIEAKAETALLDGLKLQADVLLVPHHGSKTSSTSDFIAKVNPAYAIVSAGRYNPWGHPDEKVVERYQRLKVRLFNTATDGMILIQPSSAGIEIKRYRHDLAPYWFNRALLPFAP
ncbi:DNA internalization-related competence protein ComEC/Rec2 [Motilimonas sp. KMU-193]|uniref:DNA internalization-related competence protein ComEC/Rec2 n=1 Tax=Motilimonas sp. KMU-193 TaxID=3388668 RepID=UPI00396AF152